MLTTTGAPENPSAMSLLTYYSFSAWLALCLKQERILEGRRSPMYSLPRALPTCPHFLRRTAFTDTMKSQEFTFRRLDRRSCRVPPRGQKDWIFTRFKALSTCAHP